MVWTLNMSAPFLLCPNGRHFLTLLQATLLVKVYQSFSEPVNYWLCLYWFFIMFVLVGANPTTNTKIVKRNIQYDNIKSHSSCYGFGLSLPRNKTIFKINKIVYFIHNIFKLTVQVQRLIFTL